MRRSVLKTVTTITLLSLFISCKKDPVLWDIKNLSGNKVMVFGHAGMRYNSTLPINSMVSLTECLKAGADGVEMDLQMSADSVLFLYHDVDLGDATTREGKISELRNLDFDGSKYKKRRKETWRHKGLRVF